VGLELDGLLLVRPRERVEEEEGAESGAAAVGPAGARAGLRPTLRAPRPGAGNGIVFPLRGRCVGLVVQDGPPFAGPGAPTEVGGAGCTARLLLPRASTIAQTAGPPTPPRSSALGRGTGRRAHVRARGRPEDHAARRRASPPPWTRRGPRATGPCVRASRAARGGTCGGASRACSC
jgi:hypothetical protein